jgi:hypothetical protein
VTDPLPSDKVGCSRPVAATGHRPRQRLLFEDGVEKVAFGLWTMAFVGHFSAVSVNEDADLIGARARLLLTQQHVCCEVRAILPFVAGFVRLLRAGTHRVRR